MPNVNIVAVKSFQGRVTRNGAHTVKPKSWLAYCVSMGRIQSKNSSAARELNEAMVKIFQDQGHVNARN